MTSEGKSARLVWFKPSMPLANIAAMSAASWAHGLPVPNSKIGFRVAAASVRPREHNDVVELRRHRDTIDVDSLTIRVFRIVASNQMPLLKFRKRGANPMPTAYFNFLRIWRICRRHEWRQGFIRLCFNMLGAFRACFIPTEVC